MVLFSKHGSISGSRSRYPHRVTLKSFVLVLFGTDRHPTHITTTTTSTEATSTAAWGDGASTNTPSPPATTLRKHFARHPSTFGYDLNKLPDSQKLGPCKPPTTSAPATTQPQTTQQAGKELH